ncbi:MAG: chemotaxis protein CheW [bacterium]
MKKKGIRYSELAPPVAAAPIVAPVVPETAKVPVARRNSTPVELARALAAARAAENAAAAPDIDSVVAAPPARRSAPVSRTSGSVEMDRSFRGRVRGRVGTIDVLKFRIGTEWFAVELIVVEEVIDLPRIHHVPEMPPAMLGVVVVRERLTPVYSPHLALGSPLASRESVLIFKSGTTSVGLLIDDVDDAITAELHELRDTPGADENESVVLGVLRHDDVLVAIVDADALIAACQTAALLEIA